MSDTPKRTRSPWYAFYPDDFDCGTREMSLAARGAFIGLLNCQFSKGSIPSDERLLCRVLGIFPDEWNSIRDEVLAKFEKDENGNWVNLRMVKERMERDVIRSKRIDAVNQRWKKKDTNVSDLNKQKEYKRITKEGVLQDTSTTTTTTTTTSLSTSKTSKNPQTPKGADDGFEQFWKSYPKKIGKGAAEKAWQKTKPDLKAILGALTWQTRSEAWTKDGGQYIPNPSTYINQRRWEDEPTGNVNGSQLSPGERPPENWRNVYLEALSDEERFNCGGVAPDWKTLPEWAKKRIRQEIEQNSNFALTASIK